MSATLVQRLTAELEKIVLIDPHSHINPHAAASKDLGDILGYHYYTELAHSAGLPREKIEEPGISAREKVRRLVPYLAHIENTAQYSWLMEMCRVFFDFSEPTLTGNNWETLFDAAGKKMAQPDWEAQVLKKSGLEAVFLTNDFDDPLTGFDTKKYIPCLRTDDLVFHLTKPEVRQRLAKATGIEPTTAGATVEAIGKLFEHFTSKGARACAISLPPDFEPMAIDRFDAEPLFGRLSRREDWCDDDTKTLRSFVFWTLAKFCADYKLPFDLMIGVNRRVYENGVYQGQDLYDGRCSLIQYRRLFNAFPQVPFPVSVLSHGVNQELVSYSWIFPNVITSGHWWYSNIPVFIEADCRARLEAVPQTKQLGYYSDMYKLEFGLPKFAMYRRVLAKVLAENFVVDRGWKEEQAVALGKKVLRDNVERIFFQR